MTARLKRNQTNMMQSQANVDDARKYRQQLQVPMMSTAMMTMRTMTVPALQQRDTAIVLMSAHQVTPAYWQEEERGHQKAEDVPTDDLTDKTSNKQDRMKDSRETNTEE